MKLLKWLQIIVIGLIIMRILNEPEILVEGIMILTGNVVLLMFVIHDTKRDKELNING